MADEETSDPALRREQAIKEFHATLRRLGDQAWDDRWSLGIRLGLVYALFLIVAVVVYLLP